MMNYCFQTIDLSRRIGKVGEQMGLKPAVNSILQCVMDAEGKALAFVEQTQGNYLEIYLSLNCGNTWEEIALPTDLTGVSHYHLKKINLLTTEKSSYLCVSFYSQARIDAYGQITNGIGCIYIYQTQNQTWSLVKSDPNSIYSSIEKFGHSFYVIHTYSTVSSLQDPNTQMYRLSSTHIDDFILEINMDTDPFQLSIIPNSQDYDWNLHVHSSIALNSKKLVGLSSDTTTLRLYDFESHSWSFLSAPSGYGMIHGLLCTENHLYVMYTVDYVAIYSFPIQTWHVSKIESAGHTTFLNSICGQFVGNGVDVVFMSTYDSGHNSFLYVSLNNGTTWWPISVTNGYNSWSCSALSSDGKFLMLGEHYYNSSSNDSSLSLNKNGNLYLGLRVDDADTLLDSVLDPTLDSVLDPTLDSVLEMV